MGERKDHRVYRLAEDKTVQSTETVQIVEKDRSRAYSFGRALLAALAAGTAAMAIDDTGYWAAAAAALAAAAAVYGVPTGAAETEAPRGEVERIRRSQHD